MSNIKSSLVQANTTKELHIWFTYKLKSQQIVLLLEGVLFNRVSLNHDPGMADSIVIVTLILRLEVVKLSRSFEIAYTNEGGSRRDKGIST